jgi:hypothetical protein
VSAVFIITLVLLAAIAYTIYRKQRQDAAHAFEIPPSPPRNLFGASRAEETFDTAQHATGELTEAAQSATLLARAAQGEYEALADAARLKDATLYGATLDELLKWAESSPERLRALAAFVAHDGELRASAALSRAFSRAWEQSPDKASTTHALHLAALSDDAGEFARVVSLAVQLWRDGRLASMSADDLRALVEGEFWLMNSEARASGAAFVLKQMIAGLRAELARAPAR